MKTTALAAGWAGVPAWRSKAATVLRIAEAALSIILLGTCGHMVRYYGSLSGAGLGIFTSIVVMATAGLYLAGPRTTDANLYRALPGLLDIILSGIWCIFALASGGANANASTAFCSSSYNSWGGYYSYFGYYEPYTSYYSSGLCAASSLSAVAGFLLFVALAASTVLAGLDLRDGLGLWTPSPRGPAAGAAGGGPAAPHDVIADAKATDVEQPLPQGKPVA